MNVRDFAPPDNPECRGFSGLRVPPRAGRGRLAGSPGLPSRQKGRPRPPGAREDNPGEARFLVSFNERAGMVAHGLLPRPILARNIANT